MVEFIDIILQDFPEEFDIAEAREKYKTTREESMNTVLTQELDRFNNLIKVVRSSLTNIKRASEGLIIFSFELEKAAQSLMIARVPQIWKKLSYPSLKPLPGYIKDLIQRIRFFETWLKEGKPKEYWLSGFYFAQGFLTGVLQNYSRKYVIAIDILEYEVEVFF
jgi:dynein heavy chain